MVRSGRSLESAAAVEPPTRPVPPSTSTRAVLEDLFVWAEGAPTAAAGGAQALTMPMAAAITLRVSRRAPARWGPAYAYGQEALLGCCHVVVTETNTGRTIGVVIGVKQALQEGVWSLATPDPARWLLQVSRGGTRAVVLGKRVCRNLQVAASWVGFSA
jgi:hypothetical protein